MFFRINTQKVTYETIEDETVLINFDKGVYYSFDKIGILIWGLLEKGVFLNEIIEALCKRCDGDKAEINEAVNKFILELEQEELILPSEVAVNKYVGDGKVAEVPGVAEKLKFDPPVLHRYTDMQDLLLLDPIDDVDERGWPNKKPEA